MITKPIKTRVFKENEDLNRFILENIKKLKDKSVVVVTSKIAALSEGRTTRFKNEKEKDRFIKKESQLAFKTKYVWLTLKDGMIIPSAGIDESNAKGRLIFLPKDSFRMANDIRKTIKKKFGLKRIGVLITDSRTTPLRAGVTGVALGYAGFRGVRNYIGKKDIFGRKFQYSRSNIADGLAAAAVLTMGEGAEKCPLAIIEDAPIEFCEKVNRDEVKIDLKDDMYRPIFSRISH